jgi:hypothetical protein
VLIFFECQYGFYNKGMGHEFYERGMRYTKMFLDILTLKFCGPQKKDQTATLFINKSMVISDASRRIIKMSKFLFLKT